MKSTENTKSGILILIHSVICIMHMKTIQIVREITTKKENSVFRIIEKATESK